MSKLDVKYEDTRNIDSWGTMFPVVVEKIRSISHELNRQVSDASAIPTTDTGTDAKSGTDCGQDEGTAAKPKNGRGTGQDFKTKQEAPADQVADETDKKNNQ
jgi:hypothetical protein